MPTESPSHRLLPHLRRIALSRDESLTDAQLLGAFVAGRDEAAFAGLVKRHGPMVLGVCRRIVGDSHLAEDAFQAAFLVLARRAATVRPRELVGHWLYGVAYRTALKARGTALRRWAKEKQVDAMPHPHVSPDEVWADLLPVLDEERARLPEKYRAPVVLCDLEGRTQRDAARELKVPPATLANRLAAARRLLAKRLTERGIALSGGALAAAVGGNAAVSAVPSALSSTTVKSAIAVATGGSLTGVPIQVTQLSDGVMKMFVLSKLKAITVGVLSCAVVLAGLGLVAAPALRAGPDDKPTKPVPESPKVPKSAGPRPTTKAEADDLAFLRRTSLDIRGVMPSGVENYYFVADGDSKKRTKVVAWMRQDPTAKAQMQNCQACHHVADGDFHALPLTREAFHTAHTHLPNVVDSFPTGKAELAKAHLAAIQDRIAKTRALLTAAEEQVQRDPTASRMAILMYQERLSVAQSEQSKAESAIKADEAAAKKEAQLQIDFQVSKGLKWIGRMQQKEEKKAGAVFTDYDLDGRVDLFAIELFQPLGEKLSASDVEFLRRAYHDIAGSEPSTIEREYFAADPDPKKREKLIDLLLRGAKETKVPQKAVDEWLNDPEQQTRLAAWWKQRFEAEEANAALIVMQIGVKLAEARATDPLDRLLGELLAAKKSDGQTLDALCLATMARFPTETERKLILESLKSQQDRRAAWAGVGNALAGTAEAKRHAAGLTARAGQK